MQPSPRPRSLTPTTARPSRRPRRQAQGRAPACPPATLDLAALQEFEAESGDQVAYDAYEGATDLAEKWREGPYDLVVLSGAGLARAIAAGELSKLDKTRLDQASGLQPVVLGKLTFYDPADAYRPARLVRDRPDLRRRQGGRAAWRRPTSWGALFAPNKARKMADCGVVLPDDRDTLFAAAWRMLAIDPTRASPPQLKAASALIGRTRQTARAFAAADVVSALASGAACLSVGDAGEAEAAGARSREGGAGADIRFALPREGGGLVIVAFAIPRDAPHLDQAYALLDFLLRPAIAARDAQTARLVDAQASDDLETLKRLWPQGAYDPRVAPLVEEEWEHLVAGK